MPLIALGIIVVMVSGYSVWGFCSEYYRMLTDIDDRNAADGF